VADVVENRGVRHQPQLYVGQGHALPRTGMGYSTETKVCATRFRKKLH
jgi:hypothetical protein